jgi:glucans biosynthesis protein C
MEHRLITDTGSAAAARAPGVARAEAAARRPGIDRLRVALTALVIAHHAGQAYGPTGGRWPVFEPERAVVLGPFFSVNAAFFMGLFFLLSGLFAPAAADRKGARAFLADRLLRLGLPLAIFALIIFPLLGRQANAPDEPFLAYLASMAAHGELEFGHLWFVLHLLIYSTLYALWRAAGGAGFETRLAQLPPPGHRAILTYMAALALVTALVRIWYPIDAWPRLLGLIPVEAAHLPQYLSLFVLGLVAGRAGWLDRLPPRVGRVWLLVGLAAAGLRYAVALAEIPALPDGLLAGGGANWRSLLWSAWEALICVGLCVGLASGAARMRGTPSHAERGVAGAAYGAYLIHIFPVVTLQTLLLPLALAPLGKFALVTLLAVPLSFLIVAALRRLPGAARVL